MSMREHFFLISAVHTFSCGFVRHFICINSCLLTSFLQQQIVPCKKAAIRDPALIFQSTPSTSHCSCLFKLEKTYPAPSITLFFNSIITCIARMKYWDVIPVDILKPNISIFLTFSHAKRLLCQL